MSVFGDRRLLAQAHIALLTANIRYWPTVAPLVRKQITRYKQRAHQISDPVLQALALDKLDDQRFHAQVAATLATLAPRAHRADTVEAITAIEVMYDYLDALTERPGPDPIADGLQLSRTFTDAVNIHREPLGDYYALHPQSERGYLHGLVADARTALSQLPSASAILPVAERCAARFSEAQVRAHAIPHLGTSQLRAWATRHAAGTGLGWLEYFAGATSTVLGLHAIIAAAASPGTTQQDATAIDTLYLYIGVTVTMLDSVIDYEHDIAVAGEPGYARYYASRDELLQGLHNANHRTISLAPTTPNAAHHVMTLAGVVAFYTSAPTANSAFAATISQRIQHELRPLITPTLVVIRAWRMAKALRRWFGTQI